MRQAQRWRTAEGRGGVVLRVSVRLRGERTVIRGRRISIAHATTARVHVTESWRRRSSPTSRTGRAPWFPPAKWHDGRSRKTGEKPFFAAPYSLSASAAPSRILERAGMALRRTSAKTLGDSSEVQPRRRGGIRSPMSAKRPLPWKAIACPSPSTSKISSGPRAAPLVLGYREKMRTESRGLERGRIDMLGREQRVAPSTR
jgi:hypothetical protein